MTRKEEALKNEINCVKCEHYTERETQTGIKGVCKMDTAHREDVISRQDAIDTFGLSEKTRKYGGDHSGYDTMMLYEIQDVLESLPSAETPTVSEKHQLSEETPTNAPTDLISRQDAIDAWDKLSKRGRTEFDQVLMTLPSADRPTGEWVLDPNGMDWNIPAWRCSKCGFVANYIGVEANGLGSNPMNWAGSKFCPNCGADMRGGKNEDSENVVLDIDDKETWGEKGTWNVDKQRGW